MMVVFQIGSTLIADGGQRVNIINPGMNDQVFWQVGSSATLGPTSDFWGSIIADQSIALNTGADITCGRGIALNGAVTMDTNSVDTGSCTGVPEPATLSLVGLGIIAGECDRLALNLYGCWAGRTCRAAQKNAALAKSWACSADTQIGVPSLLTGTMATLESRPLSSATPRTRFACCLAFSSLTNLLAGREMSFAVTKSTL